MTDPIFNDPALKSLSFALDGLSLRQKAIANNIANADTPNYKSQQVSFEEQLLQAINGERSPGLAMQLTDPGHIETGESSGHPLITVNQTNSILRNDGNNVDIDLEMTNLAETALRYQALAQLTGMKISLLKTIIKEAR
jgi:flagellar basal-body rod protein FlgB